MLRARRHLSLPRLAFAGAVISVAACASLSAERAQETALRAVCGTSTAPPDSSCLVRSTTKVRGGYLITVDRRPPAGHDRVEVRVRRGGSIDVTPVDTAHARRAP